MGAVAGLKLASVLRRMANGPEAFVRYSSGRPTTDLFEAEKRESGRVPGARVTDYLVEAKNFIAVTDAEVRDLNDRHIMNTPFLNVSLECIQIVAPQ
jgi:hypothetical protein